MLFTRESKFILKRLATSSSSISLRCASLSLTTPLVCANICIASATWGRGRGEVGGLMVDSPVIIPFAVGDGRGERASGVDRAPVDRDQDQVI